MIDMIIIIIYFILVLWVGLRSGNKVRDIKEFSVGNCSFSVPVLVAALSGTLIGGGATFGLAEKVFSSGLIFLVAYCGILIERILTSIFIAQKMKPFFGMITAGDIIGKLYGKWAQVATGIATIVTSIFILGAHITTTGFIFEAFTGIPLNIGLMISTLCILVYSAYGGIAAVSFTDVVQFGFMLVSIPLVAFITLSDVGGIAGIIEAVPKTHLNFFMLKNESLWHHGTIFLSYSLPALYPVVIQRMLMAKNIRQIRLSLHYNTILSAFYFAIIALIGLLALTKDKTLEAKHAFPFLIQTTMPNGIKGLIIVGLLATVMSTVDSFLNLIGVSFTHDILQPLSKSEISQKRQLLIARITMIIIGLAGLISALYFNGILENVFASMNLWLPFIFPPLFLGIRANHGSATAFFLGGSLAALTMLITKIFGFTQGFLPTLLSAASNALTIYFWPKLSISANKETIKQKFLITIKQVTDSTKNLTQEVKDITISHLKISDTLGLFILSLTTLPMLILAGSGIWPGLTDIVILSLLSCIAVTFILKDLWMERVKTPLLAVILLTLLIIVTQITKPLILLYLNNFSILTVTNLLLGLGVIWIFYGLLPGTLLLIVGTLFAFTLIPSYLTAIVNHNPHQIIEICLRLFILVYFATDFRKKDKILLENFLNLNGIMAHEVGHSIVSMNFCAKRLRNTLPVLIDCYKLHVHNSPSIVAISDSNIKALQHLVDRLTQNANRTKDTIQIIQTSIDANIKIDSRIDKFSARQAILEAFNSGSLTINNVDLVISAEDFFISANRGTVIHIFINILKNAIQALKDTPIPHLEAKILSDTHIIQFINNGPRISKKLQRRIFDNGFTTKADGQGKGLAFCQLMMTSFGGSISVDSSEKQTIFSFQFPYP